MKSKHTSVHCNIHGETFLMDVVVHQPGVCVEVNITPPRFSITRWLLTTAVIFFCGLSINFHKMTWEYLLFISFGIFSLLLLKIYSKIIKETLLVVSSVGVQVTKTYAMNRKVSHLYPANQVQDIVINEAITMHRVIFYMCLLLQNKSQEGQHQSYPQIVPLFMNVSPRLDCLRNVYCEVQAVLSS